MRDAGGGKLRTSSLEMSFSLLMMLVGPYASAPSRLRPSRIRPRKSDTLFIAVSRRRSRVVSVTGDRCDGVCRLPLKQRFMNDAAHDNTASLTYTTTQAESDSYTEGER